MHLMLIYLKIYISALYAHIRANLGHGHGHGDHGHNEGQGHGHDLDGINKKICKFDDGDDDISLIWFY